MRHEPLVARLLTFLSFACVLLAVFSASQAAARELTPSEPIVCTSDRDMVISYRVIETSGNGIEVHDNCNVDIRNCHILAGGYAVLAEENSNVRIVDSVVQGGAGALQAGGNATIYYSNNEIRGEIRATALGEVMDGGGNTVGPAGVAGSAAEKHTDVRVDEVGIRLQSADEIAETADELAEARAEIAEARAEMAAARAEMARARAEAAAAGVDATRIMDELGAVREGDEIRLRLTGDILFDFGSSAIRPDAAARLSMVAQLMRAEAKGVTIITGHTDSIGSAEHNQDLSERRAVSVMRWLNQNEGIPASDMAARGMGETQPVAHNTNPDGSDSPEGRAKNRRVEIRFATR
jgi:outer membrane protein OmpA-like peptidoglycan-associated protein